MKTTKITEDGIYPVNSGLSTAATVAYLMGDFNGARCIFGYLAPDGVTVVPYVNESIAENNSQLLTHGIGFTPILSVQGANSGVGATELVLTAAAA